MCMLERREESERTIMCVCESPTGLAAAVASGSIGLCLGGCPRAAACVCTCVCMPMHVQHMCSGDALNNTRDEKCDQALVAWFYVCKRGVQSRGQGRDAARKRAVAEFRTPDAGTNAAASTEGEESGGEESVKKRTPLL